MKKKYVTGILAVSILALSLGPAFADTTYIDNASQFVDFAVDEAWTSSTIQGRYYAADYMWTTNSDSETDEFVTSLLGDYLDDETNEYDYGYYDVTVIWTQATNRTTSLAYTLHDGTNYYHRTMSEYGTHGYAELDLGYYTLDAGSYLTFDIDSVTDGGLIIADTVALTSAVSHAPEPATMFLLGTGLLGMVAGSRRMKK